MGEVSVITFESLYDTVRKEKSSEELQKLNPDIYEQIIGYLRAKTNSYRESKEKESLKPEELEKVKTQIINARKLVKDLYERREKKILQLALHKSRLKVADESSLLPEEKMLFTVSCSILDKFRGEILLNLVNAKMPEITENDPQIKNQQPIIEKPIPQKEEASFTQKVKIRFKKNFNKFYGPDMEIYGPFAAGDEIDIYREIAQIFVKGKFAEEVKNN